MSELSNFDRLNRINVNGRTEQKNGLTYLSWAWAWAEVKKAFPNAIYTIYERDTEYGPVNYFTDGRTCWVKTGVTIDGLEHIEELPVMDFRNRSIPLESVVSTDVNKAIQRSLTKACARHGLGLYIYAGDDLPESEQVESEDEQNQEPIEEKSKEPKPAPKPGKQKSEAQRKISAYVEKNGITMNEFVQYYDAAVEMGLVPRIASSNMTVAECDKLLDAVSTTFLKKRQSA